MSNNGIDNVLKQHANKLHELAEKNLREALWNKHKFDTLTDKLEKHHSSLNDKLDQLINNRKADTPAEPNPPPKNPTPDQAPPTTPPPGTKKRTHPTTPPDAGTTARNVTAEKPPQDGPTDRERFRAIQAYRPTFTAPSVIITDTLNNIDDIAKLYHKHTKIVLDQTAFAFINDTAGPTMAIRCAAWLLGTSKEALNAVTTHHHTHSIIGKLHSRDFTNCMPNNIIATSLTWDDNKDTRDMMLRHLLHPHNIHSKTCQHGRALPLHWFKWPIITHFRCDGNTNQYEQTTTLNTYAVFHIPSKLMIPCDKRDVTEWTGRNPASPTTYRAFKLGGLIVNLANLGISPAANDEISTELGSKIFPVPTSASPCNATSRANLALIAAWYVQPDM